MKIISHRGNLNGKNEERENSPSYLLEAIDAGFDIEVDVWCVDGQLYLGHDSPTYPVDLSFLKRQNFWCHAKNENALDVLLLNGIRCFWHETDKYTLTSCGEIWCYIGVRHSRGISVFLDSPPDICDSYYGICTDHPIAWKERFQK